MLINLLVAHGVIILAALGAMFVAVPEGRQQVIRTWRLLVPPGLAAVAAFVEVIYPSLRELDQPAMWQFAVIAGVVGLVRGQFMAMEVDQIWNVLRLRSLPDALWATIALVLLALVGAVEAYLVGTTRDPESPGIRILIEIGMTAAAAFLIGRAGTAWFRIPHVPHHELVEPEA
ncbi:MAG: hypothetical protein PSV46_18120 [Reyranella sp.]|nr:hypothetical protein [Reyranella sp.]